MTSDIVAILAIDGVATGAIYVLVAIGTVLIFSVTRVIYIPFGDIAAFTVLTLAAIETGQVPGTIGLVVALACLATLIEVAGLLRGARYREIPRALMMYLVLPLLIVGVTWLALTLNLPMPLEILTALALMVPVAPLLDRIVFRPIADASVLLLLIVSMALHFALVGLGLLFFGPEGVRTQPLTAMSLVIGPIQLSGQSLIIVFAALMLSAALFMLFDYTMLGKSLRATAMNRTGARLMGIEPARAGTIAYIVGSVLAGVSGILIAPVNTIFYDSGFLLGLKAFVGAIIGGLASYPATALGAVLVGVLESFASFQSSALKDVIVFSLLIPILLWRSINYSHSEEGAEE
ncbi:branched-chain amino acid ABC transporter permease [Bradyrhizobium sp. TM239]|uniref:branched-chain amino acid ABC transporter permease n=1 Tax=Bradyrhizobium sp. TM239 TaxID=2599802 RepID=UPI0027D74875|nr:branched-chain amino acid ABC transporter permease [Bradyrhizobium sp. TM239]